MYLFFQKRMINNGYSIENDEYTCTKGHKFLECRNNIKHRERRAWKGGLRYSDLCPICKRQDFLYSVKKRVEELGYTFAGSISNDYNDNTKLEVKCSKGHIQRRNFESIYTYPRCHQCFKTMQTSWFENLKSFGIKAVEKSSINSAKIQDGNRIIDLSISQICTRYFLDPFEIYRYAKIVALPEEVERADRLKYRATCTNGHEFITCRRYLMEGHGCRLCSVNQINEPETTIGQWVENNGFEIERRIIIHEIKVDIFVPEKNIAIEYCGIRWHSTENSKDKDICRHQSKTIKLSMFGIHLITIFESDYLYNRQAMKDIVLDALSNVQINTKDARYRKILKEDKLSEPKLLYFDRSYKEVEFDDERRYYTVYDCGYLIN